MTMRGYQLLAILVVILAWIGGCTLGREAVEGKRFDGMVMLRNSAGEIKMSIRCSTVMKLRGGMLRFKDERGKRVIVYGNIVQAER